MLTWETRRGTEESMPVLHSCPWKLPLFMVPLIASLYSICSPVPLNVSLWALKVIPPAQLYLTAHVVHNWSDFPSLIICSLPDFLICHLSHHPPHVSKSSRFKAVLLFSSTGPWEEHCCCFLLVHPCVSPWHHFLMFSVRRASDSGLGTVDTKGTNNTGFLEEGVKVCHVLVLGVAGGHKCNHWLSSEFSLWL